MPMAWTVSTFGTVHTYGSQPVLFGSGRSVPGWAVSGANAGWECES